MNKNLKLIILIVNKGKALEVITASKRGGAEGGTVINGRGSSIHEQIKIFGFHIEPEKDIIFIVAKNDKMDNILKEIETDIKLTEPNQGIAFVVDIEKAIGI